MTTTDLARLLVAALVVAGLALAPAAAAAQPDGTDVPTDECRNADAGPDGDGGPPGFVGDLLGSVVPDFVSDLIGSLPVPDFLKSLFGAETCS
ncbi:histidine kinase [Halobaculum sp. EA56]|uniref:histidine kinase n=1 Tax=Halobaculum sp. EA56 TaxID=3421648 RepID=UPI003EB8AF05